MAAFDIFSLPVGKGVLALSPMPGRSGDDVADLAAIIAWRPDVVVSMTEAHELPDGLHGDLQAAGVTVLHFPVVDFQVPDAQADWDRVQQRLLRVLTQEGRILIHCMGGCGRSGMAVLRVMISAGEDPEAALARLRAVRPCAVETTAQLDWARRG